MYARRKSNNLTGKRVKVRWLEYRKTFPRIREAEGVFLKKAYINGRFLCGILIDDNGKHIIFPFPSRPVSIRKYQFSIEVLS